jgi:hypothetical protein
VFKFSIVTGCHNMRYHTNKLIEKGKKRKKNNDEEKPLLCSLKHHVLFNQQLQGRSVK